MKARTFEEIRLSIMNRIRASMGDDDFSRGSVINSLVGAFAKELYDSENRMYEHLLELTIEDPKNRERIITNLKRTVAKWKVES
jgi:hypothetical protein